MASMRQQPAAPAAADFRLDLLNGKLSTLDASIADLKTSFLEFRASTNAGSEVSEFRAPGPSSAKPDSAMHQMSPSPITMDGTERLINMAEAISFGVSTTASRMSAVPSLVGDRLTHIIDEDIMSLFDGALPGRANRRVLSWIGENPDMVDSFEALSETTPSRSPPSVISTAADPADIWTTREGSTTAESLSTLRSSNLSPRQQQFREMTPHQEFLNRKLAKAGDLINNNEMARAISTLQGLLDHLAKSPRSSGEIQLEGDVHELYARALLGSGWPPDKIDEILVRYPGIDAKAVYLSVLAARKLAAEDKYDEATGHIIRAKVSLSRASGSRDYMDCIMEKLRTELKDVVDGLDTLEMYLDINLARCYLEKLRTTVSSVK